MISYKFCALNLHYFKQNKKGEFQCVFCGKKRETSCKK